MASVDEKVLKKVDLPASDFLTFVGKFDSERTRELVIANNSSATVAFKLKITIPRMMRLMPGYGYVNPKDKFTIKVVAKAVGTNPVGHNRVVVLLAVAPDGRPESAVQFWKGASAPKDPRRFVFPLKFVEEKGAPPMGAKSIAKLGQTETTSLGAGAGAGSVVGTAAGSKTGTAAGSAAGTSGKAGSSAAGSAAGASSKAGSAATSAAGSAAGSAASSKSAAGSAASSASGAESGSEADSGAESDADESEQ